MKRLAPGQSVAGNQAKKPKLASKGPRDSGLPLEDGDSAQEEEEEEERGEKLSGAKKSGAMVKEGKLPGRTKEMNIDILNIKPLEDGDSAQEEEEEEERGEKLSGANKSGAMVKEGKLPGRTKEMNIDILNIKKVVPGMLLLGGVLEAAPPPIASRYMSVDVECVATGHRHNDREVCFVSVVDEKENVLLSKKVKPEKPVVSYLTPLTGVRKGDLDNGERLADVVAQVKGLLGRDVILVGQGVQSDIDWLDLQQGQDYASTVDLGEMFKAYNQRYSNYSFFSLSHEANTLIRPGFISEPHSSDTDAIASIKLFNKYQGKPRELEQAKARLSSGRPSPSFAKKSGYRYEGVCMAAFYPAKCFCGAPTKRS